MSDSDDLCPCGSGYKLRECCMPSEPPLINRNSGFQSINFQTDLINNYDILARQLLNNIKINIGLRKPQQLNPSISIFIGYIAKIISTKSINAQKMHIIYKHLDILNDTLHAAKYHQQQFLYRLNLLNPQHLLMNISVSDNITVDIDDMPLRYELGDYISRLRTSLDVLARLASIMLTDKPRKHGEFFGYLKNYKNKNAKIIQLSLLYKSNENWIQKVKELRDSLQHEGNLDNYESFLHKSNTVSQPTLNDLLVKYVCYKLWSDLFSFVKDVLCIIFPDESGELIQDSK